MGGIDSLDNIFRVAAGGKGDEQIATASEGIDLFGEDLGIAVVVGN